jgi:type III pantothenate kinase
MKSILVIDVGNTSTSAGIYRGGRVHHVRRWTTRKAVPDDIRAFLNDIPEIGRAGGTSLCCVVPTVFGRWKRAAAQVVEGPVWEVNHESEIGLPISYPAPETIGADRLANACAAVSLYGAPAIVADFGTALTFDVIAREKGYIGGVIAPGLPLMFSYLHEKTALLPEIDLAVVRHTVGKSTEEAMRLGAKWGYRGMVREIAAELKKHIGPGRVTLCATGGHAERVLRGMEPPVIVNRQLTLTGVGMIYELNIG